MVYPFTEVEMELAVFHLLDSAATLLVKLMLIR